MNKRSVYKLKSASQRVSRRFLFTSLACLVFLLVDTGFAQSSKKKSKKKTSISFEDELIQGEVKKPELLYLLQKKQFNFKKLIKLRENFLPEMRRTAEEL